MSKASREFFENLKSGNEMGPIEAAKEGLLAVAPGLRTMLSEIGSELIQKGAQGAHEFSAALFNGSSFVMYQRNIDGVDDAHHGLPPEAQLNQEQERGGREM